MIFLYNVIMRKILRTLFFSSISLFASNYLLNNIKFGSNTDAILIVIGLSLLYFFIFPILKLLSLPYKGIAGLILSSVLVFIVIQVLSTLIPGFVITESDTRNLRIFDFMLPSRHLTQFWAVVYSAVTISIVNGFLSWMCKSK